jgi:hypothetical protein
MHRKPVVSTKILLELINGFSKITGYKINIQNKRFFNTNAKFIEKEIKTAIKFKIASKIKT